jgi:hypothetical protein
MPPGGGLTPAAAEAINTLVNDYGVKVNDATVYVTDFMNANPGQVFDATSIVSGVATAHDLKPSNNPAGDQPVGDRPNPTNPNNGPGGSHFDATGATDAFLNQLTSMGIPLTAAARAFVASAVGGHWSGAQFLYQMRQTAWYKKAFPGILNKDGTMKMSEAQYVATQNAMIDQANALGFNWNDKQASYAIQHNLSVSEVSSRLHAERLIKDNPVYMKQLQATLKARGLDLTTKKDLGQFLMGEKPQEFYKVWREASARGAAVMAGMTLSKHPLFSNKETAIGRAGILRISKLGLSPSVVAEKFTQLADLLTQNLPEAQTMFKGQANRKDFQKAVFGGKGSAVSRDKVGKLLADIDAFYNENRAEASVSSTGAGGTQQLGTEGLNSGGGAAVG